ncbi:tRNA (guanosine(46)-N7)-methyltransferase TrmB [Buchnera aphidicola]|uniref:tRNA (guanosine(46)-N7)-methyltransferase TrmB n=1 Tax=Buchnera aphidicola TaxID=9 RepID=UPI003464387E
MKNDIFIKKYEKKEIFLRKIQSFVIRRGRITKSQIRAINNLWPKLGVTFEKDSFDIKKIFLNNNPIILEIGFGTGKSLVEMAIKNPKKNFLGIEVYESGIGNCLKYIDKQNAKNVKIIFHDAIEVLNNMIQKKTFSKIQIFFPDPWEKKRHKKRRMININFSKTIHAKLIINGTIHIITDSQTYAEEVLHIFNNFSGFINLSKDQKYMKRSKDRPITKFEKKGISLGNTIFELIFKRVK